MNETIESLLLEAERYSQLMDAATDDDTRILCSALAEEALDRARAMGADIG